NILRQVRQTSEQVVADSAEMMKRDMAKYPADFEAACRATLANVEKELEEKSSDAQHQTFENLSKASDWYQKKAQTTMQSAFEKVLEQANVGLRDRAAETSSLVASELDHYRRSYVEHTQGE